MTHRIRLRGPWRVYSGDGYELVQWPLAERLEGQGHVLGRNFRSPTNLGQERVCLSIAGPQPSKVVLNGSELQDADITSLLEAENCLQLHCEQPPDEVALEIGPVGTKTARHGESD